MTFDTGLHWGLLPQDPPRRSLGLGGSNVPSGPNTCRTPQQRHSPSSSTTREIPSAVPNRPNTRRPSLRPFLFPRDLVPSPACPRPGLLSSPDRKVPRAGVVDLVSPRALSDPSLVHPTSRYPGTLRVGCTDTGGLCPRSYPFPTISELLSPFPRLSCLTTLHRTTYLPTHPPVPKSLRIRRSSRDAPPVHSNHFGYPSYRPSTPPRAAKSVLLSEDRCGPGIELRLRFP